MSNHAGSDGTVAALTPPGDESAAVLLGRMAEHEDIANMAAYLMTDASAMVTGQTLHINGGNYRP